MPAAGIALLGNRRAPVLAAVDQGYLVYRRRLLSEMSEEQQQKIRDVYQETGFVAEQAFAFEIFGFYTDIDTAIEEANARGGSWMEVTVNHSLPSELGRYRPCGNPGSTSDEFYQRTNPGAELINRQDVVALAEVFSRVMNLASASNP